MDCAPKNTLLLILLALLYHSAKSQLTLVVDTLPPDTPLGDSIFFAGNLNGWNPGDGSKFLGLARDLPLTLTLPAGLGAVEFKFTRGDWRRVEGTAQGNSRPNRSFLIISADTLHVSIAGWEDLHGTHAWSTAKPNVRVVDPIFFMPRLGRTRTIRVYLPPDYADSRGFYPVLYLNDGQNLFDGSTSFAGEWGVDECLNDLYDRGCRVPMVVGVDHAGDRRIDEYSPWFHPPYGGGEGDAYCRFLIESLKPWIDANFRTLSGREHTGIGGSSIGALSAWYAAWAYPDVFSKALVFSPSFWFADEAEPFGSEVQGQMPGDFFFYAGGEESPDMVPDLDNLIGAMAASGHPAASRFRAIRPEGRHAEKFWKEAFPGAISWLFQSCNGLRSVEPLEDVAISISFRGDSIWIHAERPVVDVVGYWVLNDRGQSVGSGTLAPGETVACFMPGSGLYLVRWLNAHEAGSVRFLVPLLRRGGP